MKDRFHSAPRMTLEFDPAADQLSDLARCEEADPQARLRSGGGLILLCEGIEGPLHELRADTGTTIADPDFDLSRGSGDRDVDRAPRWGELQRVLDDVPEERLEHRRIAHHGVAVRFRHDQISARGIE